MSFALKTKVRLSEKDYDQFLSPIPLEFVDLCIDQTFLVSLVICGIHCRFVLAWYLYCNGFFFCENELILYCTYVAHVTLRYCASACVNMRILHLHGKNSVQIKSADAEQKWKKGVFWNNFRSPSVVNVTKIQT